MTDLVFGNSIAQGRDNVVLPADLGEFLRSVAAVEGLIGHVLVILLCARDTAVRPVSDTKIEAPASGSDGQVVCGTQAAPLRAAAFRP